MSLDRGTKIYAAVLGGICLIFVVIWIANLDLRLAEIDEMLRQDPAIAAYPYRFKALEIHGSTAVLSTPRSTVMPAIRFLAVIKPNLANRSEQDPAVISAQKELGEVQFKVKKLVLTRPDIEDVRWRLDKQWYADHGIFVD
jgi:hypothetical protein